MRMIGLDIGEKRVGVAVSDPTARVATPLKVLDVMPSADLSALRRIVEDYEAELLVVGLPLTMAGEEGPQAVRIREAAAAIGTALALRVVFQDERLSSAEAKRVMTEAGLNEKQKRGSVDMVAASILLQAYLDGTGPERDGIMRDD